MYYAKMCYISNSYTPPENLSSKNITIAFKIGDYNGAGKLDEPRYGRFILHHYVYTTISGGERDLKVTVMPYEHCKIGVNFHYYNEIEIQDYGLETYYCPTWQNLTIQGNWHSPVFSGIVLNFQRCQAKNPKGAEYVKDCANDTEFEQWINKVTVQEIILSSFFDVSDYENPVHLFLDDIWVSLDPSRAIIYQTYFKKNMLELNDDIFGFFNSQVQDHFFQRSQNEFFTSDVVNGPGEGIYFRQNFKLDKEYDIYSRQVYSFSGVLQDIGGFYNSLFFLGLLLYSNFQETLFFTSVISKLFMIEQPHQVQTSENKSNVNDSNSFEDMPIQAPSITQKKFTIPRKKIQKGYEITDIDRKQTISAAKQDAKNYLLQDMQLQGNHHKVTLSQKTISIILRYLHHMKI